MRTIKFRGKDILTDKWVYGDLLHLGNAYAIVTSYEEEELKVKPISDRLEFRVEDIAGVYPETVGQFTGLLDKNGKEIYEGDIVIFDNHLQGISQVVYDYAGFDVDSKTYRTALRPTMNNHIRVVGNIYDNPELLKGGAE